jgi:hypothetical protein
MTLLTVGLGGCAGSPEMEGMPADIAAAPPVVREAYSFAVAHPDVMTQIPCYCGCGPSAHLNYVCYVSGVAADGTITFDSRLGCSICVDITRDTQRLLDEGRSLAECGLRSALLPLSDLEHAVAGDDTTRPTPRVRLSRRWL